MTMQELDDSGKSFLVTINESLCPWFRDVNNTTFKNLVNALDISL